MAGEVILQGRNCLVWIFNSPGAITPVYGPAFNAGGQKVITSITGMPALTNDNLIESATAAELGLDKNADTRYYLGGTETGQATENTATIMGQVTVDLAAATSPTGFDLPYDLLIQASNELNADRLIVMDTYLFQTTGGGQSVYERKAAIVKVSSKSNNIASAGQMERIFQLKGSGIFVSGIFLK
jgi:hypothetical protein